MSWLEMSREETHGGGGWGFGQSLWSPSRKRDGTKWAFWETLMHVDAGDPVLHLRGKGNNAAFVGFSTAAANGYETADRPPNPKGWDYAGTFYRVPLQDFIPLDSPVSLSKVFANRGTELRAYFFNNRSAPEKERLILRSAGRTAAVLERSILVSSKYGACKPTLEPANLLSTTILWLDT